MIKKVKKYYGPAIYKVQEVTYPYSGQYKCLRLLIGIPNMEGTKPFTNVPCASFRKGYLLYQSSDFHSTDQDRVVPAILKLFRKAGFESMEPHHEFEERMKPLMEPVQTDHKQRDEEAA